jgi:hypothetical protein
MKPNKNTNPIQRVRGGRGKFSVITSEDYALKKFAGKPAFGQVGPEDSFKDAEVET